MNRRGFLQALGLGAAAFALDPEVLLWKPGAKTIFLPSVETFETFITPSWITQDVVQFWQNHPTLVIGGHVFPEFASPATASHAR